MGGEGGHTSSSSGALDSLAAVLKTLGVNDTEMEPDVLGSGTGFSNMSFFLPIKEVENQETGKLSHQEYEFLENLSIFKQKVYEIIY